MTTRTPDAVSVTTVNGPVPVGELGVTLMHEHLLNDCASCWHPPVDDDAEGWTIARGPLRMEYLGRLRNDPFLSLDNCRLDDEATAVAEVRRFAAVGGRTVVEQSCTGIGRDLPGLVRIAAATGVQVVAGCGFYLEPSHPPEVRGMSVADIADRIEREVTEGAPEAPGVRAGLIGEIGVSAAFTPAEEKVLRGAARAQRRTGVPLSVHLPGWERHGHRVLDVVAEEGGDLCATVLCHLNPSHRDIAYQHALAERGAWLEYDMIGLEFYFADQDAQSPSDEENARALAALFAAGHGGRLLLSGDVFVKTMLTRYGGFGYDHLITSFSPRLRRHGLTPDDLRRLLVLNPAAVFTAAAKGSTS
ncbi:phosphotriesterase [Streptomyces sp. NBRC 109706]|uniref:phosphotriesterase family protein n=1 Tax=Streptomyces sp. NBRC 109706 TaxID=1550035 RepID=UPI0007837786|nr:phosphotriesterase [Streptomyces sp. NBRC 109706]